MTLLTANVQLIFIKIAILKMKLTVQLISFQLNIYLFYMLTTELLQNFKRGLDGILKWDFKLCVDYFVIFFLLFQIPDRTHHISNESVDM